MPVGVLSDTHDNVALVEVAARFFRERGVRLVIHLGDVTHEATLEALRGFTHIVLRGNNDLSLAHLPISWEGTLDGVPVAATHGHDKALLHRLIASGAYRVVLHGHSHRARDERVGATRVVNPGALQRARVKSVALLAPREDRVSFFEVRPDGARPWRPAPKER